MILEEESSTFQRVIPRQTNESACAEDMVSRAKKYTERNNTHPKTIARSVEQCGERFPCRSANHFHIRTVPLGRNYSFQMYRLSLKALLASEAAAYPNMQGLGLLSAE